MKTNKIISALFGAALVAGFSACTDEVEYNGAQKTPGFYFPIENPQAVDLEEGGTMFEITVGRIGNTDEAVTVDIRNNFNSDEFHMPISVVFDANELVKTVPVYYDGNTLPAGEYNLEIGFYETTPVSEYGYPLLKIKAVMPEPAVILPWNDLGECTYTDPFLSAGLLTGIESPVSYKVKIQESGDTPGLFRLVAPYGKAFADAMNAAYEGFIEDDNWDVEGTVDLLINASDPDKVFIDPQVIGATPGTSDFGKCLVMSDGAYEMNYGGLTLEEAYEANPDGFGTYKNGIITFPAKSLLINFEKLNPTKIYYANSKLAVRQVVMPGIKAGDYEAKVEYIGQFNNAVDGSAQAVANITLGKDVKSAKAAIARGASIGAALAGSIKKGTCEGVVDVDLANPVVNFPVYAAGSHTIAVVTYNAAGEPQGEGLVSFDITLFNDDAAWTDLGNAVFGDGWIYPIFRRTMGQYEIPVQQSKAVPTLYRFKAPWGIMSPLYGANESTNNIDLYVDVANPAMVKIYPQASGFANYQLSDGDVMVANFEGRLTDQGSDDAYIESWLKENEVDPSTFEDGLITIGLSLSYLGGGTVYEDYGWYTVNTSMILLPDEEEQPAAVKAAQAVARNAKISKQFRSSFKIAPRADNHGIVYGSLSDKAIR